MFQKIIKRITILPSSAKKREKAEVIGLFGYLCGRLRICVAADRQHPSQPHYTEENISLFNKGL